LSEATLYVVLVWRLPFTLCKFYDRANLYIVDYYISLLLRVSVNNVHFTAVSGIITVCAKHRVEKKTITIWNKLTSLFLNYGLQCFLHFILHLPPVQSLWCSLKLRPSFSKHSILGCHVSRLTFSLAKYKKLLSQ